MRWRDPRSGHTLLEVLWTATLLVALAGVAFPAFRSTVDQMQARAAREAVVGFAVRVRAEARAHGGATLEISETEGRLSLRRRGGVVDRLDLNSEFGVRVEVGGSGDEVRLRFDGRGLGQVASRTIRLRRGSAERALVVSSFGRVVRR